jgi:hypothetical protein
MIVEDFKTVLTLKVSGLPIASACINNTTRPLPCQENNAIAANYFQSQAEANNGTNGSIL